MNTATLSQRLRAETPALLRLAAPLVAAQMTFVAWGVLDTVMAGRIGARELAAIAVGANIWVQIFVFFMGICIACSPIVAQRFGGGQAPERIGGFVRGALLLALGMGVVWILALRLLARPAIDLLKLAPETAALAHDYVLAESWGGVLFCLSFVLRNSAEGLGLTRTVLWAGLAALIAKFGFNLWFGELFGVVGFGWGTVAASAALLLAYTAQFLWVRRLRELQVFRREGWRLDAEALEIFRLGVPIGFILLAEVAFFGCTALLMARFGDTMVAAHQIAINFASISFMVPMGIGMAAAVRVGHAAGAGLPHEAAGRGQAAMILGLCFALFSAALMALLPEVIIAAYTRAPEVAGPAVTFLRLAALFQLFDCLQATANGALRGLKDTRVPMLITVAAYWLIGMPASYALAFGWDFGPNALWWGFTLGLGAAALGLSLRFLRRAVKVTAATQAIAPVPP
jgi:multidrug resistance protein, MATE family